KHMDPLSPYSYLDYFGLLIWKLKNIRLNNDEKLQAFHTLNVLFDEAYKTLDGNTKLIDELFEEYTSVTGIKKGNKDYENFLLEQYQEPSSRPSAAVLLYYYYEYIEDFEKCEQLFTELNSYTDIKDVVY